VDVDLDGPLLLVVRLSLLAAAAEVSWRLVEHPLRRPRTTGRGPVATRYRRAELALALTLPAMAVPWLLAGGSSGTDFEKVVGTAVPAPTVRPVDTAPPPMSEGAPGTDAPSLVPTTTPAVT